MEQDNGSGGGRQTPPLDASIFRGAARRYERTLDGTLRSAVVPYGYTVTIWASGAYLISLESRPHLWEAFAFVAGALLAFALLSSYSQNRLAGKPATPPTPDMHPETSHPIFAAGLHIVAVGIALAVAGLISITFGEAAWFLVPFAVTLIYLTIASAELAIALELRQREISLSVSRASLSPRRWGRTRSRTRGDVPEGHRESDRAGR